MFTKKTVFILGAGASWHYGYPTGEGLVKKVIEKAHHLLIYLDWSATNLHDYRPKFLPPVAEGASTKQEMSTPWFTAQTQCAALKAGLEQVNPLVIDYFLGWNPNLQSIGRLLIAWVILECEYFQQNTGGNINRRELLVNSPYEAERKRANALELDKYKDDWCRFVAHQLAINCKTSNDIFKSDVHFITFNYDISLERALYNALRHIERFQHDDIKKFLGDNRIMHVYGKVRENFTKRPPALKWSEQARDPKSLGGNELARHLLEYKAFLDEIYTASQGIYVIDPDDKTTNKEIVARTTKEIGDAERVYILGYGFDENNSARLESAKPSEI